MDKKKIIDELFSIRSPGIPSDQEIEGAQERKQEFFDRFERMEYLLENIISSESDILKELKKISLILEKKQG